MLPELLALLAGAFGAVALAGRFVADPLDRVTAMGADGVFAPVASIVPRAAQVLGRLGCASLVTGTRESPWLCERLGDSGIPLAPEQFAGLKVVSAASALALLPFGRAGLIAMPLMVLAGFRLPDFWLGRALNNQRRRLNAEIPQFLDILAAGAGAGLSAQMALQRSLPAIRGPLADELRSLLDTVSLGGRLRTELAGLSSRVDLPDLRRAVNAITRTGTLGVSLAETLADLAADVRAARRAGSAEIARKAPVKMLFPLVFMILPAFLLLTVVPVLLSTLRSIG